MESKRRTPGANATGSDSLTKGLKMKFSLMLLGLIFATEAFAVVVPVRRDYKMATQEMIEHQVLVTPLLSIVSRFSTAIATSNSATTTLSTFTAQPDVCRNVVIAPGGSTGDVPSGDVVVTGTNFFGSTITESITLAANAALQVPGSKAFCTVSRVVFPIQDTTGLATYSVGLGAKLGLKRCLRKAGDVIMSQIDGVYEGTRATCVADADEVEKNTCQLSSALDGAKDVDLFFIQNFACLP